MNLNRGKMVKEYELIITYKCNWACEYCCVDTHSRPELLEQQVLKKINQIEDDNNVTISGGEPGMLSEDFLEKILLRLKDKKCDIGINTNGLFLERHQGLMLKYISNINYHCSMDLEISKPILKVEHLKEHFFLDYLLIVHDKNIHKLEAFLNHYPEIIFNVVPASTPGSGIVGAPELSNRSKYEILKKFHNRLTLESKKRLLKEKDFSQIIYL